MPHRPIQLVAALGVAVTAISSAALLILLAEPLPALSIAAGRVAVTGVLLALGSARGLTSVVRTLVADGVLRRRALLAGALLAAHFGAWIASLGMTSVLRSVALVATQPLFAGVLGRLVGDRAPPALYLGAGVALAGTWVLVDPGTVTDARIAGDALALSAGLFAAAYLLVGRSVRERLPLPPYLALVHLSAAGWLALVMLVFSISPFPAGGWEAGNLLAVVALGVGPGVLGHGLLNWAVRRVPVHVVSLAILIEPAGATALAVLVLGVPLSPRDLLGAAILLLGVGVGLPRRG